MKKVFIGVGHGGSDPGAVANGFKEKDLNLDIALAARDFLLPYDFDVKMSRTTDENDSLEEEIKECNAFDPILAVDIHNNAGGGKGAETYYHFGGGLSQLLAEKLLAEIVKLGQNSRGAKKRTGDDGRDWYAFIRETACPAVIVECAFVDNAEDLKFVDTKEKRKAMGEAIAKGILATLGIAEKKPEEKKEEALPEAIPEIIPEIIPEEEKGGEEVVEKESTVPDDKKSLWQTFLCLLKDLFTLITSLFKK